MPLIYLSPSTQEYNPYSIGGSEEDWMNRLADAMEPFLTASGIRFVRNRSSMTAADAIAASNADSFDLHLGLHSNAAPLPQSGTVRGILVFYYPGSVQGKRAAELIADGLKAIYPLPNQVRTETTTAIGEVRRVRAPAAYLELGYHDNLQDARWISEHLYEIAENIVLSLTEYFDIPFFRPRPETRGVVTLDGGLLRIRSRPSVTAPVLAEAADGARVTILNQYEDWYLLSFGGTVGYAAAAYVSPTED